MPSRTHQMCFQNLLRLVGASEWFRTRFRACARRAQCGRWERLTARSGVASRSDKVLDAAPKVVLTFSDYILEYVYIFHTLNTFLFYFTHSVEDLSGGCDLAWGRLRVARKREMEVKITI
jgi:hypothetical protein